jgi:hypothetical protein
MTPDSTSLTLETAQNLLEQFTRIEIQSQTLPKEIDEIRQALLLLVDHSDYQILGICADSLPEALTTLSTYLTKLGYNIDIDSNRINPIKGAVYLKFNGRNQSYYASAYLEKYRGVLISYQSSDEAGVNGTYGHFPLDLF